MIFQCVETDTCIPENLVTQSFLLYNVHFKKCYLSWNSNLYFSTKESANIARCALISMLCSGSGQIEPLWKNKIHMMIATNIYNRLHWVISHSTWNYWDEQSQSFENGKRTNCWNLLKFGRGGRTEHTSKNTREKPKKTKQNDADRENKNKIGTHIHTLELTCTYILKRSDDGNEKSQTIRIQQIMAGHIIAPLAHNILYIYIYRPIEI